MQSRLLLKLAQIHQWSFCSNWLSFCWNWRFKLLLFCWLFPHPFIRLLMVTYSIEYIQQCEVQFTDKIVSYFKLNMRQFNSYDAHMFSSIKTVFVWSKCSHLWVCLHRATCMISLFPLRIIYLENSPSVLKLRAALHPLWQKFKSFINTIQMSALLGLSLLTWAQFHKAALRHRTLFVKDQYSH